MFAGSKRSIGPPINSATDEPERSAAEEEKRMLKQEVEKLLKARDIQYVGLLNLWKKAISQVRENSSDVGLSSYTFLASTEENEFHFLIFGIRCFMKFQHNFERGTIEYGVVKRDDHSGNEAWITVMTLEFDYLGNLGSPYNIHHINEYNRVHLLILAKESNKFLKAAYGTGASE